MRQRLLRQQAKNSSLESHSAEPLDHLSGAKQPENSSSCPNPHRQGPTSPKLVRLTSLALACMILTTLITARTLDPSPAGLGTHQQLGLPPCSLRVLLGVRCPSCGMTTSWAYFTRGKWPESASVNLGGFLAAWLAVALAAIAIHSAIVGRMPPRSTQTAITVAAVTVVAVSLIDWVFRLTTS